MKATLEQIQEGIIKFVDNDIQPYIPEEDKNLKTVINLAVTSAILIPGFRDKIFENELFKMLVKEDESGKFIIPELGDETDEILKSIDKFGGIDIRIKPVKFLFPEEKVLTFKSKDIKKLIQYIGESE